MQQQQLSQKNAIVVVLVADNQDTYLPGPSLVEVVVAIKGEAIVVVIEMLVLVVIVVAVPYVSERRITQHNKTRLGMQEAMITETVTMREAMIIETTTTSQLYQTCPSQWCPGTGRHSSRIFVRLRSWPA